MNRLVLFLLIISALTFSVKIIAAPIETFEFESEETEKVFHKLSDELRCLVCQNQNIAESNADLAKDLRLEIYNMLSEGKSEEEIIDFMVQRYGDYVLYRPPFKPMTWLLWLGPTIIFIIGLFYAVRFMKAQSSSEQPGSLSDEEVERIRNLHSGQENK
jgi:cytochrome c-type biogenesis protein CcmH